ncbi:MAG: class I SAM-dependent methyltransferase [Pseudomonadota bacterium]
MNDRSKEDSTLRDGRASPARVPVQPISKWCGLIGFSRHRLGIGPVQVARRIVRRSRRATGVAIDKWFDRLHKVDTCGFIPAKSLPVDSPRVKFSHEYTPTPQTSFRRMLRQVPVNFADYTFVDYGSGKGRTLLIAAEHPFKRITGIEYSHVLVAIAEENVQKFKGKRFLCQNIESIEMDAAEYMPPDDPCLFFLFSPFNGEVLSGVIDRIRQSYRERPRPMALLYCEEKGSLPIPYSEFDKIESMQRIRTKSLPFDFGAPRQLEFTVYVNREARGDQK